MHADSPNEVVLTGRFSGNEAAQLRDHCAHLEWEGLVHTVVNVRAVSSCDRAGLLCWRDLQRRDGRITVRIEGASWSQFLDLLREIDIRQLRGVCDEIRDIVPRTVRDGRSAAS